MEDDLVNKVQDVARSAGEFILTEQKKFKQNSVEIKGHNDFVSYVDKEAERIIVDGLMGLVENAGFLTEEGTSFDDSQKLTWVIDPLDGTTNFIHGVPCFAVSIALLDAKEPILGVIYEINQNEMFSAEKGKGAFLNGTRINVSEADTVASSLIGTGFPYYDYHKLDEYLALFKHLMQFSRGLRRPGSAATDLAYTACGRFDSFYEYSLSPWDVAAGVLLVREAGGMVTDFAGCTDAIFTKEIVATNTKTHNELLGLVRTFMRTNEN